MPTNSGSAWQPSKDPPGSIAICQEALESPSKGTAWQRSPDLPQGTAIPKKL